MRSARLLHVVLVAAAASAIAACGHKADDRVQVVPGAPAGDVTEASGEVSAIRDGKPRAIKAGDVVSGDDVIKTGTGARVTIVLRHNHVPWSLGPEQQKKVADSAAWLAAAGASGDVVTDDKSGAAGRHAERSATDTTASSGGGSASGSASGAGSGSAPGGGSSAEDQARAEAEAKARAMQEQLASAKMDAEKERIEAELAKAEAEQRLKAAKGGGGRDRRAPKCDPADPLCGLDDGPGGGGQVTATGNGAADVEGAIDPAQIRSAIQARAGALRACYEQLTAKGAVAGKLTMKLTVGPDGKVVTAELGGDDALAPMYGCIRGVVTKIAFPKPGGTITFTYPMTFQ